MSYLDHVNRIWDEALNYCDVPRRFHSKMRVQVAPSLFFRDGKFDANAFKMAVESEVKEWDRLSTPHVMGTGFLVNRDSSGQIERRNYERT